VDDIAKSKTTLIFEAADTGKYLYMIVSAYTYSTMKPTVP
jgi:hypothetical protein